MKKLYYIDSEYGQVFWNEDCSFMHYVHENDAQWRAEYHDTILNYFDGKLEYCYGDIPDEVDKLVCELEN